MGESFPIPDDEYAEFLQQAMNGESRRLEYEGRLSVEREVVDMLLSQLGYEPLTPGSARRDEMFERLLKLAEAQYSNTFHSLPRDVLNPHNFLSDIALQLVEARRAAEEQVITNIAQLTLDIDDAITHGSPRDSPGLSRLKMQLIADALVRYQLPPESEILTLATIHIPVPPFVYGPDDEMLDPYKEIAEDVSGVEVQKRLFDEQYDQALEIAQINPRSKDVNAARKRRAVMQMVHLQPVGQGNDNDKANYNERLHEIGREGGLTDTQIKQIVWIVDKNRNR